MCVRHPRQTGVTLKRYLVVVTRPNKRQHRNRPVRVGFTDDLGVAQHTLARAARNHLHGWIEDNDTGQRWSPEAGWFKPKEPWQ